MAHRTAILLFAVLLAASLGIKIAAFASQRSATEPSGDQIQEYLSSHGFAVTVQADPESAPAWITGTRGGCQLRIADVAPEGWTRDLISQQAGNDRIFYAFDGSFYPEQPVWRSRLEEYKRRLMRYFGLHPGKLAVRAIKLSPGCPAGMLAPGDAAALSN